MDGVGFDKFTKAMLGLSDSIDVDCSGGLDEINDGGWTPLMYACYGGQSSSVDYLLSHGANWRLPNHKGEYPLEIAASSGDLETVRTVVTHGIETDSRAILGPFGAAALAEAIKLRLNDIVEYFLNIGVDPNAKVNGEPQLCVAVRSGDLTCAKMLLKFGADPHQVSSMGKTPKDLAEEQGKMEMLRLFQYSDHISLEGVLNELGLVEYMDHFKKNAITTPKFVSITEQDLKNIGISKVGPRKKLFNKAQELSKFYYHH